VKRWTDEDLDRLAATDAAPADAAAAGRLAAAAHNPTLAAMLDATPDEAEAPPAD
jgi:hypothetical protein